MSKYTTLAPASFATLRAGDLVRWHTTDPGHHYEVVFMDKTQAIARHTATDRLHAIDGYKFEGAEVVEIAKLRQFYANVFPDGSVGVSVEGCAPNNKAQNGCVTKRVAVLRLTFDNLTPQFPVAELLPVNVDGSLPE
jgi:hypothetical protein